MTLKYSQKIFFRKSRYVWIAWRVLKLFNFLAKRGFWTGLRRTDDDHRRRYSFVLISWIRKEFIKIRSCALFRWINCLDKISSYSKIDKGLSFNFELLSFCFHCPTNCSSSGSLILSAKILNIQWGRRQASSFYHEKQFFDFFPPPPHFYCFSSTITTNSIFLLFTIHQHHRNVVVVVVGKQWTCGGGGGGKTVERNLKEIKIS